MRRFNGGSASAFRRDDGTTDGAARGDRAGARMHGARGLGGGRRDDRLGRCPQHADPGVARQLPVPSPPDERFIRDNTAAQKLGKALFWDMQAGSDGRQACASCHFNAGADNRSRNQLNPRGRPVHAHRAPNAQLTESDFPFHKLADPNNAASAVLSDPTTSSGSQGVLPVALHRHHRRRRPRRPDVRAPDPDFHVGGVNVRRSTGRNTPSVINAVFNFRNFWDGRAQNEFNGVNPFGSRDAGARVGQANASGGVDQVPVSLPTRRWPPRPTARPATRSRCPPTAGRCRTSGRSCCRSSRSARRGEPQRQPARRRRRHARARPQATPTPSSSSRPSSPSGGTRRQR